MHYADDPAYAGDWWNHNGYEWPNDVYDAARAVELAREAGSFAAQADYDAAYAAAMQLASPDLLQHRLIEQGGLRALAPMAIDASRLAELQRLCPNHAVLSTDADPFDLDWLLEDQDAEPAEPIEVPASGLLVMSLSHDRTARPRTRWTSHHPVVTALLAGALDSAVALPMLAAGEVCVALTPRSLKTVVDSGVELFDGLERKWRCLTAAGGAVHAVPDPWSRDLWHIPDPWNTPAGELFWDTVDDPRRRGITVKAAHALHQERLTVDRAFDELELLLSMGSAPRPADPTPDPDDYELG